MDSDKLKDLLKQIKWFSFHERDGPDDPCMEEDPEHGNYGDMETVSAALELAYKKGLDDGQKLEDSFEMDKEMVK